MATFQDQLEATGQQYSAGHLSPAQLRSGAGIGAGVTPTQMPKRYMPASVSATTKQVAPHSHASGLTQAAHSPSHGTGAAGVGAVHAAGAAPATPGIAPLLKDTKRHAKVWQTALLDINMHCLKYQDKPDLIIRGATWLLGWTATGYGANISQTCCGGNCFSGAKMGKSRPFLYMPVRATFGGSVMEEGAWRWGLKENQVGMIFACSPSCAADANLPQGIMSDSPVPPKPFDPAAVRPDPRLYRALKGEESPKELARFKTLLNQEPWKSVLDAQPPEIRMVLELSTPSKPSTPSKRKSQAGSDGTPAAKKQRAAAGAGKRKKKKIESEEEDDLDDLDYLE